VGSPLRARRCWFMAMMNDERSRTEIQNRRGSAPATIAKASFEAFLALSFAVLYGSCKRGSRHVLVQAQRVARQIKCKHVMAASAGPGPLIMPGKVGYRFWPFFALVGGPKSTQIGGLMGGLGSRTPKKALEGWTLVPNL
jgi:hypothetical protein